MKEKVTRKFIMNTFDKVIELGYCQAQNLLTYKTPKFYTAGVYGWNADIYLIDENTVIVTGYRPFGNIHPDYKTVEYYDAIAEKEFLEGTIEETLKDFLKEVL